MNSAVTIPAKTLPAKAAVIFLHGLGDSGAGFSFFADIARQSKTFDGVKFVFPNAPVIPITCNMGMPCPGWFDVYDIPDVTKNPDTKGFLKTCDYVKALIREQTNSGIPAEKIMLGGFSQGAAISLAMTALLDQKIGGFLVLSGFCPVEESLKPLITKNNVDTPIFQGHGTEDPVVPYEKGKEASEFFESTIGLTKRVFKPYPGLQHSTCEEEIQDVFNFMARVVA